MDDQAGTELRLKPGGLGRHNVARVGDVDDLLHRDRIKGEGDLHLTIVHAAFQLAEATDTAHEVDALVGAEYTCPVATVEAAREVGIALAGMIREQL